MQTDTPKGKIDAYIFNNPSLMVLFGTFLGGGFVLSLGAEISAETREYLLYALTAIITLFASAMALFGTFRLVNHQKEIEAENRRRRLDAARATLPLALSEMLNFCEKIHATYADLQKIHSDQELARQTVEDVKLEAETLSIIRNCIQHSEQPASIWLSTIVAHAQIMTSRISDSAMDLNMITPDHRRAKEMVFAAETAMICDHLFDFARVGSTPSNQIAPEKLRAFVKLGMWSTGLEKQLSESVKQTRKYYDETGGWSAQAFRNRLGSPEHIPD
ncbi:hypothetical protein [Pelagovum sp. HNIBRBA483]|uniref:hypothetical protein n=1 Tax=Pelagovum sp. HNIBRBA483 TaxID=3233341 RepID=UPI0034A567DC